MWQLHEIFGACADLGLDPIFGVNSGDKMDYATPRGDGTYALHYRQRQPWACWFDVGRVIDVMATVGLGYQKVARLRCVTAGRGDAAVFHAEGATALSGRMMLRRLVCAGVPDGWGHGREWGPEHKRAM